VGTARSLNCARGWAVGQWSPRTSFCAPSLAHRRGYRLRPLRSVRGHQAVLPEDLGGDGRTSVAGSAGMGPRSSKRLKAPENTEASIWSRSRSSPATMGGYPSSTLSRIAGRSGSRWPDGPADDAGAGQLGRGSCRGPWSVPRVLVTGADGRSAIWWTSDVGVPLFMIIRLWSLGCC
jgi:hypothetical protein